MNSPSDYYDTLQAVFTSAAVRAGRIVRTYEVGGFSIQLSFAGPALVDRICPGVEHLRICDSGETADFKICLWDSLSTSTSMPPPPWQDRHLRAKGEIPGLSDERIFASFQMGSDALSLMDQENSTALFWVRDAERIPWYETGSPLRYLLHLFYQRKDWQYVHGAAVGYPEAGVLLTGKGGMGKSTTALTCLFSNLGYLGDDYVLLGPGDPPTVHSLYNSAKFTADSENFFPELMPRIANPRKKPGEKSVFFLYPGFKEKLVRSSPLKAILIPRIGPNAEPRLESVSPIEGLKALAPSTLAQLPKTSSTTLRRLGDVVRKVPTYVLHLSPKPRETPPLLESLLRNLI